MSKTIKYGLIDPQKLTTTVIEATDFTSAMIVAGLKPMEVDFGLVDEDHQICVYEYGLYKPPAPDHGYFSLNGRLYAGNAVVGGIDELGDDCDIDPTILFGVTFYADQEAIERDIASHQIPRPQVAVNNDVIWQWPDPRPA